MNYKIFKCITIIIMLSSAKVCPLSMVYNFRIAQITRPPTAEKDSNLPALTVLGLVFDQYRKKKPDIDQNYVGAFGSVMYDFEPYYVRADYAVSNIHEAINGKTDFSGTETDDILLSGGRNFVINKHNDITLSGLLGLPTHRMYRLQHTDFGYSQIGMGIQLDGLHVLSETSSLISGVRYIRFIQKIARDKTNTKHTFTLGNISDMLIGYKKYWQPHGIEFGYSLKFRYGAKISPNLDDVVKKTNYIRSNFYASYKYKFLINELANRLLLYFSYGFDHIPKKYANKYIFTVWGSWSITF